MLHELAVNQDLVGAELVALGVGRVGRLSDLDLAPLLVGGDLRTRNSRQVWLNTVVLESHTHWHSLIDDRLKLFVNTLLLDTSLALNQRRF